MKHKTLYIGALAVLTLTTTSCHGTEENHLHAEEIHNGQDNAASADTHDDDEIILLPEQAKASGVVVAGAVSGEFTEVYKVTGTLLPVTNGETSINANNAGIVQIATPHLTEGSHVNAGTALFQISTQMLGDGNPVATAKAELEAAEKEWTRAQKLIEDKIISQRELEAARLRYETALATSKSYGNGQTYRKVTSPIKGYIQNLLVRNGDYVTVGQPLATITQSNRLQLRAELPERYYSIVNQIDNAKFRLNYDPERIFDIKAMQGHLVSVAKTVNKGDGFLPIIFEFDNQDQLISGSMAEIFLLGTPKHQVKTLPMTALTEEQGLFYIYIQTSDHSYLKRKVTVGANDGANVEILEGLKEGEQVVVKGAVAVKLASNSNNIPDAHAGHNH